MTLTNQTYDPSASFQNQNPVYANHYTFKLDALPDLSFFVQSVDLPSVGAEPAMTATPFTALPHPGDHLTYSTFKVAFLVDAQFKNYFSLYYWLKGYGFPHDFDEVVQFREHRQNQVGNPGARVIELERTSGVLAIATPDTSRIVAEIILRDVFPTQLAGLSFATTDSDAPQLIASCEFACSTFDIKLVT